MHSIYPIHLTRLDLIAVTVCSEVYKAWRPSLCNLLYCLPVTSFSTSRYSSINQIIQTPRLRRDAIPPTCVSSNFRLGVNEVFSLSLLGCQRRVDQYLRTFRDNLSVLSLRYSWIAWSLKMGPTSCCEIDERYPLDTTIYLLL